MSIKSIALGVVGAVVGFYLGGPMGAAWGASIGFGIGAALDPTQADVPAPGQPQISDLHVTTADEGLPIAEILGTPKMTGNIFWYGGEHVVEQTEEQTTGGKGGSSTQTVVTGITYSMSWAMALCIGPIDKCFTIFRNDEVVWHGELDRPASGGVETIILEDMGTCRLYFGTDDQEADATLGGFLDDPTLNPPLRGICWAFFDDCNIGTYNRCPTMRFVVQKSPEITALTTAHKDVETWDYNPAFAMYYVLNGMCDIPTDKLHAASFNEVAERLHGECRGLTASFHQSEQEGLTLVESILQHVGGVLYWGTDGTLHFELIRKVNNTDDFESLNEDHFLDKPEITRKSWLETTSAHKVEYSKRIFLTLEGLTEAQMVEQGVKLCPKDCTGFHARGTTELVPGETVTFALDNFIWTVSGCSDLSWLSDGMPSGCSGSFSNLRWSMSENRWLFDYTPSVDLCSVAECANYCPAICGLVFQCCQCAEGALEWHSPPTNPEVANAGGTTIVTLKNPGVGPYTYTVSGDKFWLDSGYSQKSANSGSSSVVIHAESGACAGCQITVTDSCQNEDSYTLRGSEGEWKHCSVIYWQWCSGTYNCYFPVDNVRRGQVTCQLSDYALCGKCATPICNPGGENEWSIAMCASDCAPCCTGVPQVPGRDQCGRDFYADYWGC